MRFVIGIWVLVIAATYIGFEVYRMQHPSLPWVKRRRARRLRWQWARRQPGTIESQAPEAAQVAAAPAAARQQ